MSGVTIGVAGAGAMGSGIAQIAAQNGHKTIIYDVSESALRQSEEGLKKLFEKLKAKGKVSADKAQAVLKRIEFADDIDAISACPLVIEAVVEKESIKQEFYRAIERNSTVGSIIATNTSSLAIAALSSALAHPSRFLGAHFFNPAPLMPLVEIVPGLHSDAETVDAVDSLIRGWGKVTVRAKDMPGFIVNRVARPFYGEALRMLEEGIFEAAEIDSAMRSYGFRMGPFELMDLIGNDINYTVTETVWREMYYEPRFRPSILQKRMMQAGMLGRKAGRGFYDYQNGGAESVEIDADLAHAISNRIIAMLINEAADALYMGIASREDIDLAMTKGVNYPKGLLRWADELGIGAVVNTLMDLFEEYGEDRYRPHPLLKKMGRMGHTFY